MDWTTLTAESTLTITQIARLLSGYDPGPIKDTSQPKGVGDQRWIKQIEAAIKSRTLVATHIQIKGFSNPYATEPLNPDEVGMHHVLQDDQTLIRVRHLLAWLATARAPVPWPLLQVMRTTSAQLPTELQAAMDAYEALTSERESSSGKSPRAAIRDWLRKNRPHLTNNALDRVSTVANWQPGGGAPKTPARGTK